MTKKCKNIYILYFQIFNNRALPQTPLPFLSWNKGSSKKLTLMKQLRSTKIKYIWFCFRLNAAFKTAPTSLKILRSKSWNRLNSLRRNTSQLKQERFLKAFLTCFSGNWARSTRRACFICPVLKIYKTNVSTFVRC